MGHKCSSFCRPSVTVNGRRYRVVKDLGEGGKVKVVTFPISCLKQETQPLLKQSPGCVCDLRGKTILLQASISLSGERNELTFLRKQF